MYQNCIFLRQYVAYIYQNCLQQCGSRDAKFCVSTTGLQIEIYTSDKKMEF